MICSTTKTTRTRNGPWYFTHKYADRRRLRRMVYRSSALFRLTRFTVVRSECQCFLESGEDDIKNGMRLALMVTSTYHNRRGGSVNKFIKTLVQPWSAVDNLDVGDVG